MLKRIAEIVLKARRKRGYKQEVLGQLVGCSGSYITKIEKGDAVPSTVMAMKLEKSLRLKKGAITNDVLRLRMREASLKRQAILRARFGAAANDGMCAACARQAELAAAKKNGTAGRVHR